MAEPPAPEEQSALEQARSWFREWWGAKSREQRVTTMWRLWLIVLALVVVIGGASLVRRQRAKAVNITGREWVEHATEGASNANARGMIPGSGAPPGGTSPSLPGPAQPGAGAAGIPAQPAAPGAPTASSGRGAIPPSR